MKDSRINKTGCNVRVT